MSIEKGKWWKIPLIAVGAMSAPKIVEAATESRGLKFSDSPPEAARPQQKEEG